MIGNAIQAKPTPSWYFEAEKHDILLGLKLNKKIVTVMNLPSTGT